MTSSPIFGMAVAALTGRLSGRPAEVRVIDRALGDPDFTARLVEDLDKTLDLLLEP